MHVSTCTSLILLREFQEQRDYFLTAHLRPFGKEESNVPFRRKGRQNKQNEIPALHKKYYKRGEDLPFEVPAHQTQEEYLKTLDPAKWKEQDHYLVMGLGHRRYKATDEEIKKTHKRLILKYHPDKSGHKGTAAVETKDFFACITKAFEVLSDPEKRRAYDSVDPVVNSMTDDVPDKLEPDQRSQFFDVFGPAFRSNSRWSSKQPVPQLGDMNCPEDYLDDFYDFWYNFDSWRDYSYLDEPLTGEDRWERRCIEKENKAKRKERKAEDMARIRRLVDNAFNSDPRIFKFREEEKRRKEAEKQARQEAARLRQEAEEKERQRLIEIELEKKRQEEEATRAENERIRKEKEQEKKVLKKERKTFRDLMKGWNYFAEDGGQAKNMHDVERICDALSSVQLQELNERLSRSDAAAAKKEFLGQIEILNQRIEAERARLQQVAEEKERQEAARKQAEIDQSWNDEELKLLIKAVNLYPAGTQNRWEIVAEYINHHMFVDAAAGDNRDRKKKTAKDVIARCKSLQNIKEHHEVLTAEFNKKAFDQFANKQKPVVKPAKDDNTITHREDVAPLNGSPAATPKPWSAAEQKLLEQAMKKFPASDPQRWENIAAEVQTRSKDECVKRYKELVEKIKAQKAAAASKSATQTK